MGAIASLLDLTRRSLNAQAQSIRTVGDNIANVNTPGYSRRKAELVTSQATGTENLRTGTGVEVSRVVRQVDQFINSAYLGRVNDRASAELREQYLSRAEQPFALENAPGHIDYEMTQFFSALSDLANSPSDLPLRTQVLQKGESLVNAIRDTYNQVASLQRETDTRVYDVVSEVNTLSTQIADINLQIRSGETADQENLSLRDKRDQLLRDLSELVPIDTVETSDSQVLVSLKNGFALVKGSEVQELEVTTDPSFAPVGGYPRGLDGAALSFVVYDFNATAVDAHADMTSVLAAGGGELGALLRLRGVQATTDTDSFDAVGDLVDVATRIEVISRDLLTRFNQRYLGRVDENPGGVFNSSSGDLTDIATGTYTATPVYGLFSFSGATDSDADGLAELSDLNTIARPNYSSILTFGVSSERLLATAQDLDIPTTGVLSFAPGDSSNIQAIADLRDDQVDYALYGVGSFSARTTIEGLYKETVGFVGGLNAQAKSEASVAKSQEDQVKQLYDSVSGVNLDEEFASLINFQRGFQASARLVRTSDELMTEVINLLG